METFIDLQAQVLRNGMPFTRPTRWTNGKDTFTDDPENVAHWKLFAGAANPGSIDVAVYVQPAGFVHYSPVNAWAHVRTTLSVDGIVWPGYMPGQIWIPPTPLTTTQDVIDSAYGGWTCIAHFDSLGIMDPLSGVYSILLRAVTGVKAVDNG